MYIIILWWPKSGNIRKIGRDYDGNTATSFQIMGNIHPNLNHPSKSLHVMAHNKYQECRLYTFIDRTPLKRNKNIFCSTWWWKQHGMWIIRRQVKLNPNYISSNHGNIHLNHRRLSRCIYLNLVSETIWSNFTSYKQQCTSLGHIVIKRQLKLSLTQWERLKLFKFEKLQTTDWGSRDLSLVYNWDLDAWIPSVFKLCVSFHSHRSI